MQCPSCKETIDDDSRYCDQCGEQIMVCSVCGRSGKGKRCIFDGKELVPAAGGACANRSSAKFCKQCGTAITNSKPAGHKSSTDIACMSGEDTLTFSSEDIPGTTADKMVTLDEALKNLNMLGGLKSVKAQVTKIAKSLQFQLKFRNLTSETITLYKHFVFIGNPGTGKTTVARIMPDIFKAIGMLPTNKLIEVERGDLVAPYVGESAKLVNEQCDKAMGGILFIDGAYALRYDGQDILGQEAVYALLKRMEDDWGKFVVIASGYPKEMKEFLEYNFMIKNKFTDYFYFDDYNPDEMREIFIGMCKKKKIEFAPGFDEALQKRMEEIYAGRRDNQYGNARTVRQLFDKTMENIALRVFAIQKPEEELKREVLIMRPEDLDMTV